MYCERHDLLCSHSNGDLFTCDNNMLFSHVMISCFHVKAHWCFLYNKKRVLISLVEIYLRVEKSVIPTQKGLMDTFYGCEKVKKTLVGLN